MTRLPAGRGFAKSLSATPTQATITEAAPASGRPPLWRGAPRPWSRPGYRPPVRFIPALGAVLLLGACGSAGLSPPPVVTDNPIPSSSALATPTASATPSVAPAPAGQVSIDFIVSSVEQQYPGQAGGATVTLSCTQTGDIPATPGSTLSCGFSDSNGKQGTILITINSAHGDFTWAVQ